MKTLAILTLLVATLGCDTGSTQSTSPAAAAEAFVMPPGSFYAWVLDDNGNKVFGIVEWDQKAGPNQVRILYICDYPMDFIGPLMSGHCRVDGSDCHGYEIGPTGTYAAPRKPGDSVGASISSTGTILSVADPDIGNNAMSWGADGDGIIVRAR